MSSAFSEKSNNNNMCFCILYADVIIKSKLSMYRFGWGRMRALYSEMNFL